jgi:phosphoribosylformylglycinamidine (FGAM) synthase-like enzyme
MAFSGRAGMEIELPAAGGAAATLLFNETPGQFVMEVAAEQLGALHAAFAGLPLEVIGRTVEGGDHLRITRGAATFLDEPLADLKAIWKSGLARWY